jgi:RNA polymerase sigma factor (sigma-70 family)
MDLTTLMNTYRAPLIGLIASWGAPWSEAAELAQDSFADAWLKRENCRGDWHDPEVFGRWLRGVALNRYRNWSRGQWRRRLRTISLGPAEWQSVGEPAVSEPSDQIVALRSAIQRLPARLRQVVLMHYLEETSVEHVAALLSVTAKTVEGRLYRARQNLRRMIDTTTISRIGKLLLCL